MLFENGSIIFHAFILSPSEMTVWRLTQKAETTGTISLQKKMIYKLNF